MKITFSILLFFLVFAINAQEVLIKTLHPLKKDEKIAVSSIFKDKRGWVWLGTDKGLFRFNGLFFKQYTESDGISAEPIKSITQWNNQLWIAHKKGEHHASIEFINEKGKITKFLPKEGLPEEDIEKLLPLNDSILLIGTHGEGLFFFNKNINRLFNISNDDGLNDLSCYDMLLSDQNKVMVSSDGGLAEIEFLPHNKYKVKTFGKNEGLLDEIVHTLVRDEAQRIWLSSETYGMVLFDYKNSKFIYFDEFRELKVGEIVGAVFFENEAWLATRKKGLLRWKLREKRILTVDGTQSERFLSIFKDENDMVWAGSNTKLFQSNGNQFEHYLQVADMKDILVDTLNGILYYSNKQGLFAHNTRSNQTYKFKSVNFLVTSFYRDEFGFIWAGGLETGLCRINPKNNSVFIFKNEISKKSISHINGRKGEIWVSTYEGVMFAKNTGKDVFTDQFVLFEDKEKTGEYVFKTYFDSKGGIWFCSSDLCLTYFHSGKFSLFRDSIKGLIDVHSVLETQSGDFWFATEKGVWRYDGKSFFNLTALEDKDEESVMGIAEDKYGRVVAVRNKSVDLYTSDAPFPIHFDKDDFLKDINFGININAIEYSTGGQIWIAHSQGVLIYNPSKRVRPVFPKVEVYRALVFLKEDIEMGENPSFAFNQNHLTFDFISFWYVAPEKISYQYMIENYDIDWNFTNKPLATYAGLPPGKYVLKVRATQGEFFDLSPITEFKFSIRTPIWQRWWFLLLSAIALFAMIRLIILLRTRSLLQAKRELEAKVNERTAEISAQKEEILVQRDKLQETMEQLAIKSVDLEAAFGVIEKKNKDITGSINYAKRIQNAFLPSRSQLDVLLGNYFLIFRPRDIVSGDFYWAYKNPSDEIYIAAVDCTGHGVPGAFMSLIGNSILNNIVSIYPSAEPDFILNQLDKGVREFLKQDENKTRDGMDAAICKVNKNEGLLKTASAQRPIYLITSNNEFIQIDGTPKSIGGFTERQNFDGYEMSINQVKKGDKIYLFSDGMPDQFGGENGRKFMIKNFRNLIQVNSSLPLSEQGKIIEDTLLQWQLNHNQTDDWVAIGIEI